MPRCLAPVAGAALTFAFLSCGGTEPDPETLRQALRSFETSSQKTADAVVTLYNDTVSFSAAIDADDKARIDPLVDKFPVTVASLESAVKDLEAAERTIQANLSDGGGGGGGIGSLKQRLEESKGFFASVRKFFSIGAKYRELSDSVSKARAERDQAADDIMNDVDGGQERLVAAKQKMNEARNQAIQEMGTSVSTTLVTAPIKPVTLGGMLLKTVAKKAYEKGLIAITNTKACETDVKSPSCVVGIEKTDETGQVKAPVGTLSVVISGGGSARVRVDQVEVPASGPRQVVKRDRVPIAEALPATVTRGDEWEDIDEETSDSVWIMCFTIVWSPTLHRDDACLAFGGSEDDWAALGSTSAWNAWCQGRGYQDAYADYPSEENCKKFCREMQTSIETCVTP
ncbi:MAG: hypothetical protein HY901_29985 [Deltaproteobacteria bacterium]|nr:hypothetical protein [Deltaproteobacteria bacterium]